MTSQLGSSGVSREDLALFFDGELTGAEASELGAQVEADPDLGAELEQLGLLRGLVSSALEAKAAEVPQARFEQVWDELDRALDRDARERTASADTGSIWSRMWAAVRPVRMPLALAAGAAAIALVAFNVGTKSTPPSDGPNKADGVASVQGPANAEHDSASPSSHPKGVRTNPAPKPDNMIAQAPTPQTEGPADGGSGAIGADLPLPKKVEAQIHGVEFSGKTGRISQTGTVTVLYVEEDVEPQDSERSL